MEACQEGRRVRKEGLQSGKGGSQGRKNCKTYKEEGSGRNGGAYQEGRRVRKEGLQGGKEGL